MDTNKIAVPLAIVIAGGLIAGAVYFSSIKSAQVTKQADQKAQQKTADKTAGAEANNMKAVSADDHILGDPNAELLFVEYSDTECPYCKQFHSTMHQLISAYGTSSKMAWVYRHFPIDQLHSKARKEAEATECVNELGGPQKFWQFLDEIYTKTTSNNTLDPSKLPAFAKDVGVDVTKFNECLSSGKYSAKVEAQYQDAIASGGQGTPHSIIVSKDGTKTPVEGAYPYQQLKTIIDTLLK